MDPLLTRSGYDQMIARATSMAEDYTNDLSTQQRTDLINLDESSKGIVVKAGKKIFFNLIP